MIVSIEAATDALISAVSTDQNQLRMWQNNVF